MWLFQHQNKGKPPFTSCNGVECIRIPDVPEEAASPRCPRILSFIRSGPLRLEHPLLHAAFGVVHKFAAESLLPSDLMVVRCETQKQHWHWQCSRTKVQLTNDHLSHRTLEKYPGARRAFARSFRLTAGSRATWPISPAAVPKPRAERRGRE